MKSWGAKCRLVRSMIATLFSIGDLTPTQPPSNEWLLPCDVAMTTDTDIPEGDFEERYFHGFERSKIFENLWFRLEALEKWNELAIRPSPSDCHPSDVDLLEQEVDDLAELQRRCR